MTNAATSESRERVLATAERLFAEHGYSGVSLQNIAGALGIRKASLYHHAPGGKETLFVEVMQRRFDRHRQELEQAIAAAPPELDAQLRAAAHWLLTPPAINMLRMTQADIPLISPAHADQIGAAMYDALFTPIENAFAAVDHRAPLRMRDFAVLAGAFLSLMEGLQAAERFIGTQKEAMAYDLIDVLLHGVIAR